MQIVLVGSAGSFAIDTVSATASFWLDGIRGSLGTDSTQSQCDIGTAVFSLVSRLLCQRSVCGLVSQAAQKIMTRQANPLAPANSRRPFCFRTLGEIRCSRVPSVP